MAPGPAAPPSAPGDRTALTGGSGGVRAVLVSLSTLMIGFGLVGSVLGVRATAEFSAEVAGLAGSVHYVGFLAGAFLIPPLVSRVGHIRVYAALASASAVVVLVFPFAVHAAVWVSIRLLFGLCLSGMYIVAESWLSAESTNATRGRLLALYLVTVNVAVALGQLLLSVTGVAGALPFVVASALMSLSLIPLSLTRAPSPSLPSRTGRPPVRAVVRVAPLGPVTSVVSGIGVSIAISMGPVFGAEAGLDVGRIAVLMAAGMVGSVLLQWPIGVLSDRMPRRYVIISVALASTLVALTGLAVDPASVGTLVVFAAFAALSFPLYSLAISHVNDVIDPELRVPASAVLVMAYGLGSIIGPVVSGLTIHHLGPASFWWLLSASTGLVVPYAVYRIARRPTIRQRVGFRPIPSEPAPQPAVLWAEDEDDAAPGPAS